MAAVGRGPGQGGGDALGSVWDTRVHDQSQLQGTHSPGGRAQALGTGSPPGVRESTWGQGACLGSGSPPGQAESLGRPVAQPEGPERGDPPRTATSVAVAVLCKTWPFLLLLGSARYPHGSRSPRLTCVSVPVLQGVGGATRHRAPHPPQMDKASSWAGGEGPGLTLRSSCQALGGGRVLLLSLFGVKRSRRSVWMPSDDWWEAGGQTSVGAPQPPPDQIKGQAPAKAPSGVQPGPASPHGGGSPRDSSLGLICCSSHGG